MNMLLEIFGVLLLTGSAVLFTESSRQHEKVEPEIGPEVLYLKTLDSLKSQRHIQRFLVIPLAFISISAQHLTWIGSVQLKQTPQQSR